MTQVLVTGAAGFIGHHVVAELLRETDWHIVALDRIDATCTLERLGDVLLPKDRPRFRYIWHDLRAPVNNFIAHAIGPIDYVVHLAASTHVDRSISHPEEFVLDNVLGTCHLLHWAKQLRLIKFLNFSTDEVFGPAPPGRLYKEWDRYHPTNPYAASKAGAVDLGIAFENTWKVPVVTTFCTNVFGERQHYEKFIPGTIRNILMGQEVLVHANPDCTKASTRFYIRVHHVAEAVHLLLEQGEPGEKYNIAGVEEIDNLALVKQIAAVIEQCEPGATAGFAPKLINFHESRPGHDLRYGLDPTKLRELGYRFPPRFQQSLTEVVCWYLGNRHWLNLPQG